jgi:hypothetical protein
VEARREPPVAEKHASPRPAPRAAPTPAGRAVELQRAHGNRAFLGLLRVRRRRLGNPLGAVLQAKLDELPQDTKDLPGVLTKIGAEIDRQRATKAKVKGLDERLKRAAADLAKAGAQLDSVPAALTVDRLNRIIAALNKNIDDGVPDAEPVAAASSSSSGGARPELSLAAAQRDPRFDEARGLGLFDDPDLIYWLRPDYLAGREPKGIPENKLKALVVELQAKSAAEDRYEPEFIEGQVDVFKGIVIEKPDGERVREIDVLTVWSRPDDTLVPLELLEVKKAAGKKPKSLATDIAAKVKGLVEARASGHRVMWRGEDIGPQLVVDPSKLKGLSAGPSDDEYDVPLKQGVADALYDFVNTYRYALSKLWHAS